MQLNDSIRNACGQISPLWPLANFVAVNPFMGYSGRSFAGTAHYLSQVQDAQLTMPLAWYGNEYAEGKISRNNLKAAIERAPSVVREAFAEAGQPMTADALIEDLDHAENPPEPLYRPGTFSAYVDAREDAHWAHAIREEAAKWCAAYYDKGQATWLLAGKGEGFYAAWHKSVRHDYTLACMGLKNAHRTLAGMPDSPMEAITGAIKTMSVPEPLWTEWLYRVLLTLPGWAGHLRYLDREKELRGTDGDALLQLLAILLNYECTLYLDRSRDRNCLLGWKRLLMEEPVETANEPMPLNLAQRILWQSACEHSIEKSLQSGIRPRAAVTADDKPAIQAAFCIDVRSELFRRNLETAMPEIQTIGFAGFFGVPLNHLPFGQVTEEARCPALLVPPIKSCGHTHQTATCTDPHQHERGMRTFKESAASCFSFVETLGLSYAWKLLKGSFGLGQESANQDQHPQLDETLDREAKVALAAGIVRGLTLTKNCAKLVLLCGHGSTTRNNPYASGLDCGACGGHPGDANARIAAALLNNPDVRSGLREKGINLPPETVFIAGLHNTTTDEVRLFDVANIPASHQQLLKDLQSALMQSGLWTAAFRAQSLDVGKADAVSAVRARSADWSQVRPEWGLAGNAGFLVAPRAWSRSADLKGKAFLHEYDPESDPEGTFLESILAGPLVVGSWINLQYYASAADNAHYGSGHKAIHNVVGGLGVALGNENDLRPGLPLQSVHNGKALIHEPSRLHALIAAAPETIDAILGRQPDLKELFDNEWLHLFALGSDGSQFLRRQASGEWRALESASPPHPSTAN